MSVDVYTEIVIGRPADEVARFACDPDNAPRWYQNIELVEWKSEPRVEVGATMAFVARFLGRRLAYDYTIIELEPSRFVMRTSAGPFPMETTYTFESLDGGRTRMGLRNRGEPSGFGRLAGATMAPAMRRANRKDLAALKAIIERQPPAEPTD